MITLLALLLAFAAGGAFSTWIFFLLRLVRLEEVHATEFDPFAAGFAPPVASVTTLSKKK